jgi:hypothetical protein
LIGEISVNCSSGMITSVSSEIVDRIISVGGIVIGMGVEGVVGTEGSAPNLQATVNRINTKVIKNSLYPGRELLSINSPLLTQASFIIVYR